jgi:hypothetical protein
MVEDVSMDKIYTVTTLFFRDGQFVRQRTPGWYTTIEEARQCIEENWGDIYEHAYYNYALIEALAPGLYNIGGTHEEEEWFKAIPREVPGENYLEYDIEKTEKPEEYKGVINFSIG